MSERSVAEIIGWEIVDNPWYETRGYPEERTRIKANGEYWNMSKRPTVDDLLAWLHDPRNKRHGCSIQGCAPNDTDGEWCVILLPWVGEYYDEHRAPTLLEALEAAVRAVDERTER